jgi:branched-chain amino acid transport system substrate-binding protein
MLLTALSACSSSSKSASSSTTASSKSPASTSSPASSSSATSTGISSSANAIGTPIKIGFICTCTGLGGQGGFNIAGKEVYTSWVDSVNAAGGINGHPVQLITEDDTTNPGLALTEAKTFISDHVVAIADLSELDQAFASTVQAANIPVVGIFTVAAPFESNPDFYPEGQTGDSEFDAVAATAKAAGATQIAQFYCAEAPQCAVGVGGLKAAGKTFGIPDIYNVAIAGTAPNYTAQCVAADQAHAGALFIADVGAILIKAASECAQQGYKPTYVIDGEVYTQSLTTAPAVSNSLDAEFPDLPFFANTPGVNAAKAAVDKYYPGLFENGTQMNQDAFMAWVSGELLETAIKAGGLTASGTPSPAEVVNGLDSFHGETLGGLTPPLTYTPGQPHHIDCWFTAGLKNGVPSLENNGNVTCTPS